MADQLMPVTFAGITFNGSDQRFILERFPGHRSAAKPRAELVQHGAAAGAVAIGPWQSAEKYSTIEGRIRNIQQAELFAYRNQLLSGLPAKADVPVTWTDYDGVTRVLYVRRYDAPEITFISNEIRFSFPMVSLDPLTYDILGLGGTMGVFAGSDWYRTYILDTAPTPDDAYRTYTLDTAPTPDDAYRTYIQAQPLSPYPQAIALVSPGSATSRRLTIEVTGPVNQGDWKLVNETTGDELWADLQLTSAMTVVFDCFNQIATVDGTSVDQLVYGEWLTFEPGGNNYRLVAGEATAGFATITDALPAYE